jgi:hypothetical protein
MEGESKKDTGGEPKAPNNQGKVKCYKRMYRTYNLGFSGRESCVERK